MAMLTGWPKRGLCAVLCLAAVTFLASPGKTQEDDGGFADNLAGIVNALDIFFSMPLNEWNREIVRLPNVAREDIFGSIERGLGVRFGAGSFVATLEPDFETPAALTCLRIVFETTRAFSADRLSTIENDKIKPMMETLSLRYGAEYALQDIDPGILFTLFITRRDGGDCQIYDQVKLRARQFTKVG
ncbi:MAG: hypothetical protein RIM72_06390 [Alphaproteobacteria bacterium]